MKRDRKRERVGLVKLLFVDTLLIDNVELVESKLIN